MKKIQKWLIVIFLLIAMSCAFGYLLYRLIYRLPETKLARDFLFENKSVLEEFGTPKEIRFSSKYEQRVSWLKNGPVGEYTFVVKGSQKEGLVRIHWHSQGSGTGFKVDGIEILEPAGWRKLWFQEPER